MVVRGKLEVWQVIVVAMLTLCSFAMSTGDNVAPLTADKALEFTGSQTQASMCYHIIYLNR